MIDGPACNWFSLTSFISICGKESIKDLKYLVRQCVGCWDKFRDGSLCTFRLV